MVSKKSYTLLEYLVYLENKMKDLKNYVDNYDGIVLGDIDERINAIKNQSNELKNQFNNNALLYFANSTNDTTELQNMFDYARDNNYSEIKIIGECVITKPILFHSNIKLSSVNGKITLAEGLTLQTKGILAPSGKGVKNVIIEGITFDQRCDLYQNNGSSPCISINKCKNITIRNCIFKNIQTMAVWFDDSEEYTENIKILDNTIENSYAGGFSVFGYCKGLIIRGNYIKDTKDDAIALQPCSNGSYRNKYQNEVIIEGNVIEDCCNKGSAKATARGIICWAGVNVTIRGNVIKNTYSHSIYVFDGEEDLSEDNEGEQVDKDLNVIVEGNVCINAGEQNTSNGVTPANGIDVRIYVNSKIRNILISNNIISNSLGNGIYVNCNNFICSNNIIKDIGQSGIFLQNSNHSIINNNLIEKNVTGSANNVGIYLYKVTTDNNIHDNRIFGVSCKTGIIIHSDAQNNIIKSNNFKGCITNAIVNNGTNNEFYENITIAGNPISKIHTLSSDGSTFAISGLSCIKDQPILIQALNDSGRTLLQQGYRVNAQNDLVELRTVARTVGDEKILIRCL